LIVGHFDDGAGAPHIQARVILPTLDLAGKISFLVDTGATVTCLFPKDSHKMGIKFEGLDFFHRTVGVGGNLDLALTDALLVFEGRDHHFVYETSLAIAPFDPNIMKLPSILGRDITCQWAMSIDPLTNRFECTPANWSERY
jgi:hypothetical protein